MKIREKSKSNLWKSPISKQTMQQTIWSTAANEPAMIKYTVKSSKPGISGTSWTGGRVAHRVWRKHTCMTVWLCEWFSQFTSVTHPFAKRILYLLYLILSESYPLVQTGSDSRNNNSGHLKLSRFKYTEMLASQQCDNNDVVAWGNVISKHP